MYRTYTSSNLIELMIKCYAPDIPTLKSVLATSAVFLSRHLRVKHSINMSVQVMQTDSTTVSRKLDR